MNFLKLFLAVAACLLMSACDSGECGGGQCDEPEAAEPGSVEVVVNFLLMPDKSAFQPMWVSGRHFRAGTNEADVKPVKCVSSPINDAQMLKCSLGNIPTSSDIRFMVNIPMSDGDNLPACATTNPNECVGIVKVTLTGQSFVPPVSLVEDKAFKQGVAYKVLVPTPHAL